MISSCKKITEWFFPWLQIVLSMESFCKEVSVNETLALAAELKTVKEWFTSIQVFCCILGVIGNVLNIRTLQSGTLQTVPFMYIRALAYFDLIALTMILNHFGLIRFSSIAPIMFYTTYIEAPVINTFLIAGLYCAFCLTIERYCLISRPHHRPSSNPRKQARRKIAILLGVSFCIHLPMALQRTMRRNDSGEYVMVNNIEILCQEPYWSIYNYYKLARECVRVAIVIIMTALNVVIAKRLKQNDERRNRLVRRSSPQNNSSSGMVTDSDASLPPAVRREESYFLRSFTEGRLTILMAVICFIFVVGNIPQIVVMILQNEAMEHNFKFQLYRHCSNTLEVLNHCLNFYVFCVASREYTRAFVNNCVCLQRVVYKFPFCRKIVFSRRSSSVMVPAGGFGIGNRDYLSMESFHDPNNVGENAASPFVHADPNVRGILVTANRETGTRQKKSLTIVNHNATDGEGPSSNGATQI
ncbi:hypothetical protein L5515_018886 [Caenorhabditis briggsae]|uniref:G-protein coupled receptors family 1 profile domain-containing protein n=2 Tax=Caenorhabditis briggsae TaxID=6238 RepID=A0AAE9JTF6_CAEBR|nr:hypothetical protein L5515_018886 [Caenorhabditis briggsae]